METLCPFCGIRPLSSRVNAKTCGSAECMKGNFDRIAQERNERERIARKTKTEIIPEPPEIKHRKCLKCNKMFETIDNCRLCDNCHRVNAGYAPRLEEF